MLVTFFHQQLLLLLTLQLKFVADILEQGCRINLLRLSVIGRYAGSFLGMLGFWKSLWPLRIDRMQACLCWNLEVVGIVKEPNWFPMRIFCSLYLSAILSDTSEVLFLIHSFLGLVYFFSFLSTFGRLILLHLSFLLVLFLNCRHGFLLFFYFIEVLLTLIFGLDLQVLSDRFIPVEVVFL